MTPRRKRRNFRLNLLKEILEKNPYKVWSFQTLLIELNKTTPTEHYKFGSLLEVSSLVRSELDYLIFRNVTKGNVQIVFIKKKK